MSGGLGRPEQRFPRLTSQLLRSRENVKQTCPMTKCARGISRSFPQPLLPECVTVTDSPVPNSPLPPGSFLTATVHIHLEVHLNHQRLAVLMVFPPYTPGAAP